MMPVTPEKTCAGNPRARFEEGVSAQEEPRRKALCDMDEDKKDMMPLAFVVAVLMVSSAYVVWDVCEAAPTTYMKLHRVVVGKDFEFMLILIRRAILTAGVLGGMMMQWLRLWRTEACWGFSATSGKLLLAAFVASRIATELAMYVQDKFDIAWHGVTLGQAVDIVTLVAGMPLLIMLFDKIGKWLFRQKKLRGVFAFLLKRKSLRHSTAKTTV